MWNLELSYSIVTVNLVLSAWRSQSPQMAATAREMDVAISLVTHENNPLEQTDRENKWILTGVSESMSKHAQVN